MFIFSRKLSFKKLVVAKVYLNQFGKIFAKAFFLLVISLFLISLLIMNGLRYYNIIFFMLETYYTISDIELIIYCNFWLPHIIDNLGLIILLILESFYILGNLGPSFFSGLEISSAIDSQRFACNWTT